MSDDFNIVGAQLKPWPISGKREDCPHCALGRIRRYTSTLEAENTELWHVLDGLWRDGLFGDSSYTKSEWLRDVQARVKRAAEARP
jgi:hypothetical protein